MNLLSVDLAVSTGAVKPMHCVNNGPVHSFNVDQRVSNLESYRAAGIPYARTHDASSTPPTAANIPSTSPPSSPILTPTRMTRRHMTSS